MAGIILGGTAGGETLSGTGDNDSIYGNGGNDHIYGGDGSDSLFSGEIFVAATGQYLVDTAGDMFFGEGGNDRITASAGNDILDGGAGNDILDGGAGWDSAVYAGTRASVTVAISDGSYTVTSASGGTDTLVNVERIRFADIAVAYDYNGLAGEVYRLYQAAFDRTPDLPGMGFWLNAADNGVAVAAMAGAFASSAEFKQTYGENLSNAEFIALLYNNALNRNYEQEGMDFWMKAMNDGYTRAQLLNFFADSPENRAQVIGSIQGGIEYVPYG